MLMRGMQRQARKRRALPHSIRTTCLVGVPDLDGPWQQCVQRGMPMPISHRNAPFVWDAGNGLPDRDQLGNRLITFERPCSSFLRGRTWEHGSCSMPSEQLRDEELVILSSIEESK